MKIILYYSSPWRRPRISLMPPRTGRGRAIRTIYTFLHGRPLAWDFDRMELKDIIPVQVLQVVTKIHRGE